MDRQRRWAGMLRWLSGQSVSVLFGKALDASCVSLVPIDPSLTTAWKDQWFEEDTPIFVHPKDPFKRIDTLQSNREIRISLNGHVLAETPTSVHLLETTLPTRYYIPLSSINAACLRPSGTRSLCPYKGEAEYHDVVLPGGEVLKDLVWYYTRPTAESVGVVNLRCFYNEKVDIEVKDAKGKWKKLERPVTHFV